MLVERDAGYVVHPTNTKRFAVRWALDVMKKQRASDEQEGGEHHETDI